MNRETTCCINDKCLIRQICARSINDNREDAEVFEPHKMNRCRKFVYLYSRKGEYIWKNRNAMKQTEFEINA